MMSYTKKLIIILIITIIIITFTYLTLEVLRNHDNTFTIYVIKLYKFYIPY